MFRIKGLRKYVKKYGRHLTEDLAYSAIPCIWTSEEVQKEAQRAVYYNVTSATLGDMLFLANYIHNRTTGRFVSKRSSVSGMLHYIGNYRRGKHKAFDIFLSNLRNERKKFDFNRYI